MARRPTKDKQSRAAGAKAVISRVREFNRFYTRRIGVLQPDFLGRDFSLTEVRVLYEIANRGHTTASDLVTDLELDPGYVSRLLTGFEAKALLRRRQSAYDGRARVVVLTPAGRKCFSEFDTRQTRALESMLGGLGHKKRERLITAMKAIEQLLQERRDDRP